MTAFILFAIGAAGMAALVVTAVGNALNGEWGNAAITVAVIVLALIVAFRRQA